MLAGMRFWSAIAVTLPALTCVTPTLDLTIDTGTRCSTVAVEVLDDAVLMGWTVHALAVLDATGDEGWALATDPNKRLKLQPLPDGPGLDLTELVDAGAFDLVPGPLPGEAWLLFDRPAGARVWRLGDAARGELTEAPDLSAFPDDDEVVWTRRLIFVGGVPHLLAVPNEGDASTLILPMARLDRETLAIVDTWSIDFWWTCDQMSGDIEDGDGCMETPYELIARLELLAVTQPDGAGVSAALIGLHAEEPSETPELEGLHHTVVTSLELRDAGPDVPPDAYRHDRANWAGATELMISPAQIGADDDGLYVLAGVLQPPDAMEPIQPKDFLISAEHANERDSGVNNVFGFLDRDLRSHLLQVDGEVALGQFLESEWRVAPIVKDGPDVVVDTTLIAGLPVAAGSVARGAGFGQMMLRPPQGPALRVHLVCADDIVKK